MQRNERFLMRASELGEGDRRVIVLGDTEVGVYRISGKLYAYENLCAHQGGPACEGLLMPKVENVLTEAKCYERMRFNYDEWHIVCPWHAWEYSVITGRCVADPKYRLKRYEVIEKDGGVYVII
jgi:nitrite reductase (NADH) small subunit